MPKSDAALDSSEAPVEPLRADARARLGSALRRLGNDVVGHHVDDELLDELTATLTEYSARFRAGERQSRAVLAFHEHWDAGIGEGEEVVSSIYRPFSGQASPWSLEPVVQRRGDGVTARLTLREAHEGAPERSHGGIVAGLFDDILGCVLHVTGEGAFTGELVVRYENAVPLHRELTCECRIVGREGRKLYMTGELLDGEVVVARTTATFITPRIALVQSTFDPA